MSQREAGTQPIDLDRCRDLELERPVVEVLEGDVTDALKMLAASCAELEDKRDFNALAKHLGYDDALGLRRELRAQLVRRGEDAIARILFFRVMGGLLEHFEFQPTAAALDLQVASLKRDAEEAGRELTAQEIETTVVPLAAKRARGEMLMKSLAKSLGIAPTEEEILAAFDRHAVQYRDAQAIRDHLLQNAAAARPVLNELIQNLVVNAVLGLARVTDRAMTQDEMLEALERATAEVYATGCPG